MASRTMTSHINYSRVGDVNRTAPFSTYESPSNRTKLIGGRMRTVMEDNMFMDNQTSNGMPSHAGVEPQLSSRAVLPAINTSKPPVPLFPNGRERRHFPEKVGALPPVPAALVAPIVLSKAQQNALKRNIREDIRSLDFQRLKELYLRLANYDVNLSGFMRLGDFLAVIDKSGFEMRTENVQLLAGMFLSNTNQGQVNYEKILSFISAAMKENNDFVEDEPSPEDAPTSRKYYVPQDPITGQPRQNNYRSEPDNARLLAIIENALLNSEHPVDMGRVHETFRRADADLRGRFSGEQIRMLVYACRLPLQESVINQILEKCDCYNGQYSWEQFLGYLERVQPQQTSLPMPLSRQPLDIAKKVPEPSPDWPRAKGTTVIPDPKVKPEAPEEDLATLIKQHNTRDLPAMWQKEAARQRGPSLPQLEGPLPPTPSQYQRPPPTSPYKAWSRDVPPSRDHGAPQWQRSPPPVGKGNDTDLRRIENELGRLRREYENLKREQASGSRMDVAPLLNERRIGNPLTKEDALWNDRRQTNNGYNGVADPRYLPPTRGGNASPDGRQGRPDAPPRSDAYPKGPNNGPRVDLTPWTERFGKLVTAMYTSDVKSNGHLPQAEARWLIGAYNQAYELNISESQVDRAMESLAVKGYVPIDALLNKLSGAN